VQIVDRLPRVLTRKHRSQFIYTIRLIFLRDLQIFNEDRQVSRGIGYWTDDTPVID